MFFCNLMQVLPDETQDRLFRETAAYCRPIKFSISEKNWAASRKRR